MKETQNKLKAAHAQKDKIDTSIQNIKQRRLDSELEIKRLEEDLSGALASTELGEAEPGAAEKIKQRIRECRETITDCDFAEKGLERRLQTVSNDIRDGHQSLERQKASVECDRLTAEAAKIQWRDEVLVRFENAITTASILADRVDEGRELVSKLKKLPYKGLARL